MSGSNAPEATTTQARQQAVDAARRSWSGKLMDLSRRNNLLYFRDLQTGTLDLTPRLADVRDFATGAALRLAADTPDTRNRLRRIRDKALENLEERGLETLHVAVGLATWTTPDDGRNPSAPVLLLPAVLRQRGRDALDYTLALDGDADLNPALVSALVTLGVTIDPQAVLAPDVSAVAGGTNGDAIPSFETIFAHLAAGAGHLPGFAVTPRAILGNFSFQKMAILRDLQECGELLGESDIVAALAGDAGARAAIAERRVAIDPASLDVLPPVHEFTILDADSSQQRVVAAGLAGQSGVVQGPPGTGKSQTIANLIAALAADGRRVLFVAEKRAALEAVFKRLEARGLADLALDLHGADISRKLVARRLERSLQAIREAVPVDGAAEFAQLTDRRNRLRAHVQRLHGPRAPSGQSVFQLEGGLLALGDVPLRDLPRWRGAELDQLTAEHATRIRDILADLSADPAVFLRDARNAWAGAAITDGGQAQRAADLARELPGPLRMVVADSAAATTAAGFPAATSFDDHMAQLGVLEQAAATLARYRPSLFGEDLAGLARSLAPALGNPVGRLFASWFSGRYRGARRAAAAHRVEGASPVVLAREVRAAAALAEAWHAHGGPGSVPLAVVGLAEMRARADSVAGRLAELEPLLGRPVRQLPPDQLTALAAALAADTLTPQRLPAVRAREAELAALGAAPLLSFFRQWQTPPELWARLFTAAWLRSCLDRALAEEPELAAFDGRSQQRIAEEFARLDHEFIDLNARRVRHEYAGRAVDVMNAYPAQEQLVRSEAKKSTRHLPVRRLIAEAPDVVTALCPCVMASPLSVSQLLGRGRYFDFVLFDEASQVLPEDAVTSLMRGRAAIVAGDRNQLPPTQFFADGGDEDTADPDADPTAVQGYESLLDQMSGFLAPWSLEWHYRSKDERLIAFSNEWIYDRTLVTFPGSGKSGPAVSHVLVEGPARERELSVAAEVERVVDIVVDHARQRPGESLGVIALGITHARRIEAALLQRRQRSPELDEFFAEDRAERFFIKNLERVQGDERDAIILTLGAGKDAAGKVSNLQFGPLNSEGGRRRLNVAVTRAKQRMTLVSSFSHFDMTPAREGTGTELLRHYLEYAATGGERMSAGSVTAIPLNPFEIDIRDTLVHAGIPLVPQLGASQYRIDFAAQHPAQPGRFVLAIEADGAAYHSAPTARDRDRLRQEHLERLGWKFHRIWSTDWFTRKDEEVARTVSAWQAAVAAADADGAAAPRPPAPAAPPASDDSEPPDAPDPARGPRPRGIGRRASIDDYTVAELRAVVRWVKSDGLNRTDAELIPEVMRALGFNRRGARIVEAIQRAIDAEDRAPR